MVLEVFFQVDCFLKVRHITNSGSLKCVGSMRTDVTPTQIVTKLEDKLMTVFVGVLDEQLQNARSISSFSCKQQNLQLNCFSMAHGSSISLIVRLDIFYVYKGMKLDFFIPWGSNYNFITIITNQISPEI